MPKSEQQRLEEILKTNPFLDHIFHCIHDGIILTDPDGRITFVNPSAEEILGLDKEALVGTNAVDIPVEMYTEEKDRLAKRNTPFALAERTSEDQGTHKVILQRKDGKTTPLLFNVGIAEDDQMVAILTDIGDLLHRQQQMEEYFNLVAHDLRAPLTVVLSYAEMLSSGDLDESKTGTAHAKVLQAGRQMKEMLEGLTDRMRIEAGNFSLDKAEIDLAAILNELATNYAIGDDSPHIEIKVEADLTLNVDANLIKRALHNLLGNAVKYSPKNSLIEVTGWRTGHGVVLTVSDQGSGIDPEDQPYIFDPFFITSVGKQKGGIGLGLHITEKIIQAHRGNLFVCSQPGEGTTFGLFLPCNGP